MVPYIPTQDNNLSSDWLFHLNHSLYQYCLKMNDIYTLRAFVISRKYFVRLMFHYWKRCLV